VIPLPDKQSEKRRGAVVVLAAFLSVVFFGFAALTLDIGYLCLARTQLQNAADAAALAAAAHLVDESRLNTNSADLLAPPLTLIRTRAQEYAQMNQAAGRAVTLADNPTNDPNGDIVVAQLTIPGDLSETLLLLTPSQYNTVQVSTRFTESGSGAISLFFGRVFGYENADVSASATATVWAGVAGFRLPAGSSETVKVLPIAVSQAAWNTVRYSGGGADDYYWDSLALTVTPGPDGIREMSVFPNDTSSGNFGILDIGHAGSSTADVVRQVQNGLSVDDLAYHGGALELNPATGTLLLGGATGLSAGMKGALESIVGEPRIVPLYSTVIGSGSNATYTIVGFAGARIVHVQLTGSKKALVLQMANVMSSHAVINPSLGLTNDLVYTTPRLTR
jgi:Flp pilus assembly protein TadG